ncbi:MAG: hypothetical protein L3J31_01045 [Bacteroidales bacterium]|nr:hypothetical protein [Bacteroidales bacterium]MCF6341376.1 hypothetical protein [Bacteroidales bacterium]
MITQLIIVSLLVFLLNIPFGYWRGNVRRFSLQWVLAVHIPVPFIIALRLFSGIGFAWFTYVFLVGAFFLGQRFGAYLLKRMKRTCKQTTSCLVMDAIRCYI